MKKDVQNLFNEIFEDEEITFTFDDGDDEIIVGDEPEEDEEIVLTDDNIKGFAKMYEIEKYHTKKKKAE